MGRQTASDIYNLIEPYILQNINQSAISLSGGVPDPHDISGIHHTGVLSPIRAPDFFLLDGSRPVTGNIIMQSGKTVDGVDISEHVTNASAHHEPFIGLSTASGDVQNIAYRVSILGGDNISISSGAGYIRISSDVNIPDPTDIVAGDGISVSSIDTHTVMIGAVSANDAISVTSSGIGLSLQSSSGLQTSGGLSVVAGHAINVSSSGVGVIVDDLVGNGVENDGGTISLGIPTAISLNSSNGVGSSTHSHAILSSSAPGLSASILATDQNGGLTLGNQTLSVDTLNQSVWINSGEPDGTAALKVTARRGTDVALELKQASQQNVDVMRILDNNNNVLFVVTKDGALRSGNYVSGASGVTIEANGYMEVNDAVVRGEIRSSIFTAQENHAIGSTVYIRESASLYSDLII